MKKRWMSFALEKTPHISLSGKLAPVRYWEYEYSGTSYKQPAKMSSLGGGLWEVFAYESLDHNGQNFF